ncbi:hypothetical protein JCM9492_14360 [Aquifex pyrophilus]
MKVLLVFYKELEKQKDSIFKLTEENYRLIRKKLGIDNLYAVITEGFLDAFKLFPEFCFINNTQGTLNFGVYKGMRKLKGEDILVIDAGKKLVEDKLVKIPLTGIASMLTQKGKWAGVAYIPKREIYYFLRSLEKTFDRCITDAFKVLKSSYGIDYLISDIDKGDG